MAEQPQKSRDPRAENRRLRQEVARLSARLVTAGLELPGPLPELLETLTPQELALYQALADAKGRFLTRFQIEQVVPVRDHAVDRSYRWVNGVVLQIRRRLGADVIVTEKGRGCRLGRAVA